MSETPNDGEGARRLREQERRNDEARPEDDTEEAALAAVRREARESGADTSSGYYLYGVNRAGAWRTGMSAKEREELLRIRYRDLEALVRAVPFALPDVDREAVQEHQRVVWSASKRDTLLPAPAGIVFKGRRAVIRFLQEQYIPLEEGIALVEGHWELRLHLKPALPDGRTEAAEAALQVYGELRRFARAAFPFAHEDEHVLSAAFLVNRSNWLQFMDHAEELGHRYGDLVFDVTGPWPPYDFIRITR